MRGSDDSKEWSTEDFEKVDYVELEMSRIPIFKHKKEFNKNLRIWDEFYTSIFLDYS